MILCEISNKCEINFLPTLCLSEQKQIVAFAVYNTRQIPNKYT